eukprot:Nitzschia sp. Nitz4//scaffold3_size479765//182901//183505//NITZ4_000075-RA/size479765-snap-gene-0.127-mRNA-1//1//CDS//3329550683//3342//frame0
MSGPSILWLFSRGPADPKHQSKLHPLVVFLLHYSIVAVATVSSHDSFLPSPLDLGKNCTNPSRQFRVGIFMWVYFICFMACRFYLYWNQQFYIELYKQTFLCSLTVFHTALGLSTGRPVLAEAFCIAVGIDQLLWWVDLGSYVLCISSGRVRRGRHG